MIAALVSRMSVKVILAHVRFPMKIGGPVKIGESVNAGRCFARHITVREKMSTVASADQGFVTQPVGGFRESMGIPSAGKENLDGG
ncbi:MAG: hypothetical protein ACK4RK_18130 [Gemmataceae bacterium]